MKFEGGLDSQLPRFVLLRHVLPAAAPGKSHWDLMLETSDLLFTLQLAALPSVGESPAGAAEALLLAKRLPGHRPLYLDYEGEVSGNRGSVERIAAGQYTSSDDHWWMRADAECSSATFDGRARTFTEPVRIQLESQNLVADFEFLCAPIGKDLKLTIHRWALK